MKVLMQRVSSAQVSVDGQITGAIQQGLVLLIGIEKHDQPATLKRMAERALSYRVFADNNGKMNLSVRDIDGGVLAISQFTLAADTQKGLRPGFSQAAPPEEAKALYQAFVAELKTLHQPIEEGIFGADMQVSLTNDGPVTFMLEL